jgi:hypothetical protein
MKTLEEIKTDGDASESRMLWICQSTTSSQTSAPKGKMTKEKRPPLNFPVDSYGSWPENLSLRREDIYNECGRKRSNE